MNYDCPEFGSSRTKALSLIYANGTTEVRYNSFYIGTRRNFGYIPTFGRRQSLKARLAAPPKGREWTLIGWFFLFGVAMVIAWIVLASNDPLASGAPLVIAWLGCSTGVAIWDYRRAQTYNTAVWPALWQQWNQSYLCERCGCIFEQDEKAYSDYSRGGRRDTLHFTGISDLERRVNHGDRAARKELAKRYELGIHIAQDRVRGAKLYLEAAKEGDAEAKDCLEALYIIATDDELKRMATNGDAAAEATLGDSIYYHSSDDSPEQMTECARWYRAAADHGCARAMAALAHMYSIGKGVPEDLSEAKRWADAALALGEDSAKDTLEWVIDRLREADAEKQKELDFESALQDRRNSADSGDTAAQVSAGIMLCMSDPPRDRLAGLAYLRRATACGHELADYLLAVCLKNGSESEQAESMALLWQAIARRDRNTDMCSCELGRRYLKGVHGAKKDPGQAAELFEMSAVGWSDSSYELARMYSCGEGRECDLTKAYAYSQYAFERNGENESAKRLMSEIEPKLSPEQVLKATNLLANLHKQREQNALSWFDESA